MNRIVLIGNGFDMAHGLKTSYQSFIDNIWNDIISSINDNLGKSELDLEIICFENLPCFKFGLSGA